MPRHDTLHSVAMKRFLEGLQEVGVMAPITLKRDGATVMVMRPKDAPDGFPESIVIVATHPEKVAALQTATNSLLQSWGLSGIDLEVAFE